MRNKINKKATIIIYVFLQVALVMFFMFIKQRNDAIKLMPETEYVSLEDENTEIQTISDEENTLFRIETQEYITEVMQNNKLVCRLDTLLENDEKNNISRIEYLIYDGNKCIISMKNNDEEKTMIGIISTDIEEIKNIILESAKDVLIIDEDGFTYTEGFMYRDDEAEYFLPSNKEGYKKIEDVIYKSKFKQDQMIDVSRSSNEE